MRVIDFKFRSLLKRDPFRINEVIEPIYYEIAEMVIFKIYKSYPFNPLFETGKSDRDIQESIKAVISDWADCFMEWRINDLEKANQAIKDFIYMNVPPTLGFFRAVYFNEQTLIENHIYVQYTHYLYRFCADTKDGLIHGAKHFSTWIENKNDDSNDT